MLASLRRGFREEARKGHASAFVISGNQDGSLKLTQSRVLSASGVVYALVRVSLAVTLGFGGLLSKLRGAKGAAHEVRERDSHVGSSEFAVHEILARVGPNAALAMVCCDNQELREAVVARAADRANESWDGSSSVFLASLSPGSEHDWVRAALDA